MKMSEKRQFDAFLGGLEKLPRDADIFNLAAARAHEMAELTHALGKLIFKFILYNVNEIFILAVTEKSSNIYIGFTVLQSYLFRLKDQCRYWMIYFKFIFSFLKNSVKL